MVTKDTTLKITVDVDKAEAKARSLANELNKLGETGKQAGQKVESGMTQSAQALTRVGDSAAAAQVRFQTMTQGMLNLSTAAVQTYTSTSNLDRVMVKAKASTLQHERAIDALNRKQFQLNREMDRAVPNMEKIRLLRSEIKTATENETIALEKMKIAQQDVTDVQLLFISNIANVGVASIQTFTRMIGEQRTAMIANTIVTKLNSLANINNATTLGSASLARSLDSAIIQSHMRATLAGTVATKLQTVALQGLKIALGPIGLVFIGISAAMAAYETNALGLKDTINGLLGIHDDLSESMEDGKETTDEYNESLGNLADSFGFKIPNSIASAVEQLERYKLKIGEATERQLALNKAVGASPATNFDLGGVTPMNKRGGIEGFIHSLFNPFPEAGAESTPTVNGMVSVPSGFNLSSTNPVYNFIKSGGKFTAGAGGPTKFGVESQAILSSMGLSRDSFEALSKDEQFMAVFSQGLEPFLKRFIEDPIFRKRVKMNSKTESGAKFFTPDEFRIQQMIETAKRLDEKEDREADVFFGLSKEMKRRTQISMASKEFLYTGASVVEQLRKQGFNNTIINGIPVSGIAKFNVAQRDPLGKRLTTNEMFKILGIKKDVPMTIEQTIALIGLKNLQGIKGSRNIGSSIPITKDMLPIEMGGIQNVLFSDDFNRLNIMESSLRDYSAYINTSVRQNNFTQADKFRSEISRLLLTAGGKSKGLNTGRGLFAGVSATAAFQTSGRFKIDPIFETQRRQQDRLANSEIMGLGSIFGFGGSLSRSGSKAFRGISAEVAAVSNIVQAANLFGFGSDPEFQEELMEIKQEMFDRFNAGGKQAKYATITGIGKAASLAEKFGNKVEGILRRVGIDFETTQPVYTGTISRVIATQRGNMKSYKNVMDTISSNEQFRIDVGASRGISLPFGTGLVNTVNQFINNGLFSNFNNVSITKTAMAGLNLTEQAVFDIRFQATRGDRELLNRLRHIEMLQAGTSGTSPL